ncbi:MAG: hypothetical protein LBD59_08465 [Prevotellaceae bacterium]|nr:hypothetical protein [Prevotellaceae bacterium]
MFGRGTASSGLSWQAAPANKDANAGTACVDRVDKVKPCPNKGYAGIVPAGLLRYVGCVCRSCPQAKASGY